MTRQIGKSLRPDPPDPTNTDGPHLMQVACGLSISASAAEDPANSKLLKQCESAQGQVKRECEAVAKKMIKKEPEQRADKTGEDVTHSSPAMTIPSEAKKEEAAKDKPRSP